MFLAIQLGFPAMGGDGRAVPAQLGGEIPIEFGPGGVAVGVSGNVVDAQLSLVKVSPIRRV